MIMTDQQANATAKDAVALAALLRDTADELGALHQPSCAAVWHAFIPMPACSAVKVLTRVQATKDAATIAQLVVAKLIKEPVAAVMAFK